MSDVPGIAVRVKFSTLEDARRVVVDVLAGVRGVSEASRGRIAGAIVADLRDARLLAASIEQHYSAVQVASLLGRSVEWVTQRAKAGAFGPVSVDGGGYLIPASGVQRYLDGCVFSGSKQEVVAA